MLSFDLNWFAVIVVAIGYFVLGMLWWSPLLFGKMWMKLMNVQKHDKPEGMAQAMIGSVVCALVMTVILSNVVYWSQAITFMTGMGIGFLVWLGFVVTTSLNAVFFEKKKLALWAITAGYYLVGLVIAGGVLAIWA